MRISDLLEGGDSRTQIRRTFDFMAIAEDEIAKAVRRTEGARRDLVQRAFAILFPGDLIRAGEELYRSHCRELLTRVRLGEDVIPGTDAECCYAMMMTSLKAPLAGPYAHAYGCLFIRVFPQHAGMVDGIGKESYPGEADEIIADMRKRIGAAKQRGKVG